MQQFLQWVFKETNEKEVQRTSNSTKKKDTNREKGRSKEIVVSTHCGTSERSKGFEGSKFNLKKLKSLALFCRKDIAKSCFYSTINIKRPKTQGFDNMQQYWIQKMKKEDIAMVMREISQKADSSSSVHTGIKVLPLTDVALVEQCTSKRHEKKVVANGESKTKPKSRMKELFRWAVASKSEKGGKFITGKVSRMQNGGSLKAGRDDDRASTDSPKISFRWEAERCSSVSSAYSSVSAASSFKNCSITLNSTAINHYYPRKGSWITTDSEFVVLEL